MSTAELSARAIAQIAHADHTGVDLGELACSSALRLHAREAFALSSHSAALVAAELMSLFAVVIGRCWFWSINYSLDLLLNCVFSSFFG